MRACLEEDVVNVKVEWHAIVVAIVLGEIEIFYKLLIRTEDKEKAWMNLWSMCHYRMWRGARRC